MHRIRKSIFMKNLPRQKKLRSPFERPQIVTWLILEALTKKVVKTILTLLRTRKFTVKKNIPSQDNTRVIRTNFSHKIRKVAV